MDYYSEKQFLAQVDQNDQIVAKINKWVAHQDNILHRGFTVIIEYDQQFVLQHRRHLVFDKLYDLSFSSHPVYKNDHLQSDTEAILDSLFREWKIEKTQLIDQPKLIGSFYYQAKDAKSKYFEHEIDRIYQVELKTMPDFNPDFAYGYQLVAKKDLVAQSSLLPLAPWVKKIISHKLIS